MKKGDPRKLRLPRGDGRFHREAAVRAIAARTEMHKLTQHSDNNYVVLFFLLKLLLNLQSMRLIEE